jgi:hypothetical protein
MPYFPDSLKMTAERPFISEAENSDMEAFENSQTSETKV